METLTPHDAAVPDATQGLALDDSELHVQLSEFVLHPLRALAASQVVASTSASVLSLE